MIAFLLFVGLGISVVYYNVNHKISGFEVSSTLVDLTPEELSAASTLIIKGKVKDISKAQWNTPDGKKPDELSPEDIIYKDITIQVKDTFKGDSGKEVKVWVYNGEVDDFFVIADEEAEFKENEDVFLFLGYDDSPYNKENSTDHYITVGSFQGKFTARGSIYNNKKVNMSENDLIETVKAHKNDKNKAQSY